MSSGGASRRVMPAGSRPHLGADCSSAADDFDRRRLAHVFGIGLKVIPRMAISAFDRAAERGATRSARARLRRG